VIRSGQVLCHGTPNEVLQNKEARKHYFGEGMDMGVPAPRMTAATATESRLAALRGKLTGRHATQEDPHEAA
jgi:hypothetical protein